VEGQFYVTIREIQLTKAFLKQQESCDFEGACVSLENQV
jgi:hypothetical protein